VFIPILLMGGIVGRLFRNSPSAFGRDLVSMLVSLRPRHDVPLLLGNPGEKNPDGFTGEEDIFQDSSNLRANAGVV